MCARVCSTVSRAACMTSLISYLARPCDVMSLKQAGSPCCCRSLLLILLVLLFLYSWHLMYEPCLMLAHSSTSVFNYKTGRNSDSGLLFAAYVNVELLLCQVMPLSYSSYSGCLSEGTEHQKCNIVLHQCFHVVWRAACVDAHLLP